RKELEDQISQLQQERGDLHRGLSAYREHTTALERLRKELEDQLSQLQQERGDLKTEVINLVRDLGEYQQHLCALQDEIASIRKSRSWRWTGPFRRLVDSICGSAKAASFFV